MNQPSHKLEFSIALLSASVIGYQLALMQILSIQQWHYMAFMVISIALLGFGTSGTLLAIFKDKLLQDFDKYYTLLLLFTAISMLISPLLTGTKWLLFDTYLLFSDLSHILRLLGTCVLYFIPFLWAATAIGMSFTYGSYKVGKLYFANLVGSGLGGIFMVLAMWVILPQHLSVFCATMPLIGAGIYRYAKGNIKYFYPILSACIIMMAVNLFFAPTVKSSQFKGFSKTMNLPDAKVTWQQNSPFGLVQQVASPAIRYAPSVSLLNTNPIPYANMVFVNGDAAGYLTLDSTRNIFPVLNYSPQTLAYRLKPRPKNLVLQSGTGEPAHLPMLHPSNSITCIESNPLLHKISKSRLSTRETKPELYFINTNTRSFLKHDQQQYDVILFPTVGSFYGTTGLYALEEQNWLTVEAFSEAWEHLSPDGVLSVSCWLDYPYRNSYKLVATLDDILAAKAKETSDHLMAVKNWNQLSFLVKRTPFTKLEYQAARLFCDSLLFDFMSFDQEVDEAMDPIHELNDPMFTAYLKKLTSPQKTALYHSYPFKIRPATDNKPYFSHFIKLGSLSEISKIYKLNSLPYFELGYYIALVTLLLITLLGIIFIILPLIHVGKTSFKSSVFLYFSAIGLGYMITEMSLIHQFNIYFSNPTYTIAIIIGILLISSGLGSYFSKYSLFMRHLWAAPLIVSGLLIILAILNPIVINSTISYVLVYKIAIVFVFIGSIGFFMGIPFPSAILKLSHSKQNQIPTAWAINGLLSVIATPLAVILSMEFGFSILFTIASASYLMASIFVNLLLKSIMS
ncbi:hypothetical protein [Saccharicrinis sp. 156]|uniref:hypothetical protein n=1 Tax=Saccharicrinis sp. 156 TaxID=3417574 RepID=UPI003D358BDF